MNWDAALTLGTCGVVIMLLAWRPINSLWMIFTAGPEPLPLWLKIILGTLLVGVFSFGITFAVVLLGYWSAIVLDCLGFPQGVLNG